MGPRTKRDIMRILPFGLIWMVFTIIYTLLEKSLLGDLATYPSTGNPYRYGAITFYYIVSSTFMGLIIGTIEVKYLSNLFSKKSFSSKIFRKTMVYVVFMILVLLGLRLFGYSMTYETNLADARVWESLHIFFVSRIFWTVELYIAIIIISTLFFTEVSESIGFEVLRNFFIGKYHTPIEENRIFMFLDMNASTTIAEKLGHVQYFSLLRDYYEDLSDPIIQCSGQIYQYVGDEVIISWRVKNTNTSAECIKCFLLMQEKLASQSKIYQKKYGVTPSFKAGIHFGLVTSGEIGALKKEIVYTGDVLNTTARIISLCKEHLVDILISSAMKEEIGEHSTYQFISKGTNKLRGKNKSMELFTLKKD
jgi:adenylate cyclase